MIVMTKKKNKRRRELGLVVPLNAEIDRELHTAFMLFLDTSRPKVSIRAAVETALEDFLRARDLWPPKASH
jgi:hypothetical protein